MASGRCGEVRNDGNRRRLAHLGFRRAEDREREGEGEEDEDACDDLGFILCAGAAAARIVALGIDDARSATELLPAGGRR